MTLIDRLKAARFGDIIENEWASPENPIRKGYLVRIGKRTGRLNPGMYYQMTDGYGKFWEIGVNKDSRLINHGSAIFTALQGKDTTHADK